MRHSPVIPLVAVAHGSRDPRAAAVVTTLLDQVRLARPDLDIRTAYLDHAPPTLAKALATLDTAVVLPLLLTAAYHTRVDIPAALREATTRRPRLTISLGPALGPHPLLTTALERRLTEAGIPLGEPETAVVLVSAGSSDARANQTITRLASQWSRSRSWWSVTPAFASAATPTPEAEVTRLLRAGAPRVVVAPYLLAPGYFADKVTKETTAAGAHTVSDVLGAAPELTTLILRRYTEALHGQIHVASA
ncbi:sirohydrochlorin chelatase [Acrocarpospora corrugata]|uniref:Sirohydrochlorin chelatase n=1 Tax=Acrocarpospora corrugata TaxID=35763 RepID=A0A5M3VVD4_9ACTN|nr:sirohydrochlorin chelatase [Acrocarpospora corrugata]GER98367.1 sirohydrochlorin chelatase [Acrocarpospora corrugata]